MLQDYILNPVRTSCFARLEMTDYPVYSANCKGMIKIRVCSENVC
jgi:hypothetical protein